jgi:hypothetical protein
MSNNQQIFEDWLEGKITEQQCQSLLQQDALWLERMQNARILRTDAAAPRYEAIAEFDSSAVFARQWQRPKPRRSWWPQVSLALSCAAMLISLSPAQLQLRDGSLTLSWHNPSQEINAAVATALTAYQQEQQQWLVQQLDFQQQNTSSQLVLLKDYLQTELKQDQRSDMLQLVEYLNQQRQSDWQYWQENYQPMQANYRPADSYYVNPTNTGVVKP